jgi:hypothetical protein
MRNPMMRRAACAALLLAAGLPAAALAQGVQRCEAPDGKVTYSNTKCPDGTANVRAVNTAPPVSTEEQKAAKERAQREAAAARAADKTRAQAQAKAERAAADQEKAESKGRERCERAQRDLERAKSTRAALSDQRATTVAQMQKADNEIGRRETEVAKACAR